MAATVLPTLLGLPAEPRNLIYEFVFAPGGPITDKKVFESQGSKNLALLRTCKQIYSEARLLAFASNIFITGQYEFDNLLNHLTPLDDSQWESLHYIALATHWNADLTDTSYGGSFGTDLSPAVTNFLWSALAIFLHAKHIVLFNPGSRKINFRHYLRVFVEHSYSKSLGTNPHGWDVTDHPENEYCYTLKSHNTDRVVMIEYARAWTDDDKEPDGNGKEQRQPARGNPYHAPEIRGGRRKHN